MKWFKKKEKKEKIGDRIGHKVMGDIYDNVKLRSAILLGIWVLFIIVLFIILKNYKPVENKEIKVEYPNIITLFDKDYKMEITLYDNNKYIYYIGNLDKGIKKIDDIEINYQKINNIYYDLNNNEIEDPFMNIDTYYLDLNNIKNTIINNESIKDIEGSIYVFKYNTNYNNKDILITIKCDKDSLKYINYKLDEYNYTINLNI